MANRKIVTRHHYLNKRLNTFNTSVINSCIESAMQDSTKRIFYQDQKLEKDFQIQPLELKNFGVKALKGKCYPLAYGLNGITNLIHEIGSSCPIKRYEALNTLSDLLYDSVHYAQAIYQYQIVKRLEDVFFRCIPVSKGRTSTFDLIVENLAIISCRFSGAQLMIKQYNLIDAIYEIILCQNTTTKLGSKILKNLSKFPAIAEEMVFYNHLGKLKEVFKNMPITNEDEDLFIHLSQMIYVDPVSAMSHGYFEFLCNKIKTQSNLLRIWAKCFALLLDCEVGQKAADNEHVIQIFYDILNDRDNVNDEDTLEYIVLTLQNSTSTTQSLWKSREFWNFPLLLLRTAFTKTNSRLQIYSLQTLRNISTMPSIKNYMRKVCKYKILQIVCLSKEAEKLKAGLLAWLRKKCYINIDKTKFVNCEVEDEKFTTSELVCDR